MAFGGSEILELDRLRGLFRDDQERIAELHDENTQLRNQVEILNRKIRDLEHGTKGAHGPKK